MYCFWLSNAIKELLQSWHSHKYCDQWNQSFCGFEVPTTIQGPFPISAIELSAANGSLDLNPGTPGSAWVNTDGKGPEIGYL